MKNNSDYWIDRFKMLEEKNFKQGTDYASELKKEYSRAIKCFERSIALWYQRIAENNGVSMLEARKLLKGKELKEFKWDVEEYIKYGRENAVNGKWLKELENASAKAHISKYEQIILEMKNEINVLYDRFDRDTRDLLNDVFREDYNEAAKMLGHSSNYVDDGIAAAAVEKPWANDEMNFSSRIWSDKDKLIKTLNRELTQGIIRGDSYLKIASAVRKSMNTSYKNAERLVVTETAAIQTKARLSCLKDLGCEYYSIDAGNDAKTCSVCRSFMDIGKIKISEFQIGVTAPPFHPRCRCAAVPWYEEIEEKELAKDEESGIIKMYRKGDDESNVTGISDKRFNDLTIEAKKLGAKIIRDEPWFNKRLEENNSSAVTYGDVLVFRKNATVSDVLEETYHFKQNLNKLNDDKPDDLRTILNEIDAKQYLLENIQKYGIPRNETELTKKQLENYKKQLREYEERSET